MIAHWRGEGDTSCEVAPVTRFNINTLLENDNGDKFANCILFKYNSR